MNKSQIREIYKQKRALLNDKEVTKLSNKIAENFIKNLAPKISDFSSKKIAFYIPINNEVDPASIIKFYQNSGHLIALPKIATNNKLLEFKAYKIGDRLISNSTYPKLLEPQNHQPNIVPDIIFTPLVAFNASLERIGMGAGFYDATIDNFKKNRYKTIFIGLGYDWQNYQKNFSDKWDQNLDFIVSEKFIYSRNQ